MQAFLKLSKVWPWLPHFRVVAEYESLSRASRKFGMSAAALSKAVRTLERALDIELFDRAGGKLRLNEHGRKLLSVVRTDMRELDDAIEAMRALSASDHMRVGVDAAWAAVVLPLRETGIELLDAPSSPQPLLRGELDVALHTNPIAHAGLDTALIATYDCAVFGTSSTNSAALPFVVWARGDSDGWPPHRERHVAVSAASLAHAIAITLTGRYVAVLPVAVAVHFGLREVPSDVELTPMSLWGSVRASQNATKSAAAHWRDLARDHARR